MSPVLALHTVQHRERLPKVHPVSLSWGNDLTNACTQSVFESDLQEYYHWHCYRHWSICFGLISDLKLQYHTGNILLSTSPDLVTWHRLDRTNLQHQNTVRVPGWKASSGNFRSKRNSLAIHAEFYFAPQIHLDKENCCL